MLRARSRVSGGVDEGTAEAEGGFHIRIAAQNGREAVDVGVRASVDLVGGVVAILLLLVRGQMGVSGTEGLSKRIGRVVLEVKKHHHDNG